MILFCCTMTLFILNFKSFNVHGTWQLDLTSWYRSFLTAFFAYPGCQRFFLLSQKRELFLTVRAGYFILGISRTDLLSLGTFVMTLKTADLWNSTKDLLIRRHKKLSSVLLQIFRRLFTLLTIIFLSVYILSKIYKT